MLLANFTRYSPIPCNYKYVLIRDITVMCKLLLHVSDKNFEDDVLCTQLQTCDGGVAYASLFHNTFTYNQWT